MDSQERLKARRRVLKTYTVANIMATWILFFKLLITNLIVGVINHFYVHNNTFLIVGYVINWFIGAYGFKQHLDIANQAYLKGLNKLNASD